MSKAEEKRERIFGEMMANPEWNNAVTMHDWRNHVPQEIKDSWRTLSHRVRVLMYRWASNLAGAENWDSPV